MKKNLLILGYALGLALLGTEANSQINYSQGFEGTHNWTAAEFFTTTEVPCEGLQSFVSDLHGGFVPNGNDATVSPSLGTSDGSVLTFSYTYKLVNSNNPGSPVLNSSDWGSFTVSWGTSASGPWTPIETINPANHIQSLNCAERTATFSPADGSQVFIRVNTVLNNFSNFIKIYVDDITATQITCTTPAPTADATQMVCAGSTLADLEVEGDQILWYTAATEGFPISEMTELSDGGIYYAAQIPENGCESNARTAITVDLIVTPTPTGDATQEFINNDTLPIVRPFSDLNIQTSEAAIVTWYLTLEDAQNGENGLTEDDGFAESGTYYVTQTIGGCVSEPFAVTVDVILGSEDFAAGSLKYYPNPVKDVFTISYTGEITAVAVYTMLGQEVLAGAVPAKDVVIDMTKLQAGAYIIKVTSANAAKTIKVMKH